MIDFKNLYNQQDFLAYLIEYYPNFEPKKEELQINKKFKFIKSVTKLGKSKKLDVDVYEIEHVSENDPRVTLSKEAFSILREYIARKSLVVFKNENTQNYRLSLITFQSTWESGNRITTEFSNPRRYSFFLGPDAKVKTPTRFLIDKGKIIDFEDLKNRFSLEVVNKEFYKDISEQFIKLVGGSLSKGKKKIEYQPLLKLPSISDKTQKTIEFAVRLIGRVIFCWFLREKKSLNRKSLVPKDLLSYEAIEGNTDYYHKILEPIFFEILNKQIKTRRDEFVSDLFSSIPYLNGGLFSPQDDDFYKRNNSDFQSQYHNTLIIPDQWFTEFFEVLETYNFTIDENTSFDEELSIDPEMLGRIFENLLAEINPETGESARKSTGSYYTPRVIVDYMVDESLLLYLKEQTKIDETKLRAIVSYDLDDDINNPTTDDEKSKIVNALEKVKILDPACGSGAFPIGALQKIVFILQQVDPNGKLWKEKQLAKADPEFRKDIEKRFSNKEYNFIRKLGIIRDCIYGIDIQPIATEISRLRCFLTLIVDEQVEDTAENRGIKPLPNLDFKFVTANSLIGLPKVDEPQGTMFDDYQKIDELKKIRDEYFNSSGIEREQLKTQFVTQQKLLFKDLQKEHGWQGINKAELTNKLTDWDPFTHKSTPWFDPEWMFGIKDGFDIVIANPPYIDSEGMVNNHLESLREYIVKNYKYARGNWDIYIAFFEKGFQSLKKDGILSYISPDKWISKSFGDELRKNKYRSLFSILNAGRNVFESVNVDSIVSIFFNEKQIDKLGVFKIVNKQISFIRNYEKINLKYPFALDCVFSPYLNLVSKLEKCSSGNNNLNCENACSTSDAYKLSPLIENLAEDFNPEKHFKIINTGTIGKWFSKWGLKEMTYLRKKYTHPTVFKKTFFEEFKNSYSSKSTKPKLILKGLNLLDVCLDLKGVFIPGKSTLMISGFNEKRLKYLMAYLNTPLPIFYIREKYPASSYNQGTTFTKDMINNLPIPQIPSLDEDEIIKNVDAIINLIESEDYLQDTTKQVQVKEYEKQINQMVYKLYGLTNEEIDIVEGTN